MALPMAMLNLYLKGRKDPEYRRRWKEHFGSFKKPEISQSIWIHSVSVGESLAAIPIIKRLQHDYPEYSIVVTTTTATGAERIRALLGDSVFHFYSPYDLPWVVKRFIRKIKPKLTLIMETELWPNFIYYCKHKSVPLILVNARLSARSAGSYARLPIPTKKLLLDPVTHFACQAKPDSRRFITLGAEKEKVSVTGSIKFDLQLPENLTGVTHSIFNGWTDSGYAWTAGSTHQGEEEIILKVHQELLESGVAAKLILVPRHPERFDSVAELIIQRGFKMQRRSDNESIKEDTQVVLCDTMGELIYCYSAAQVAFVGGSLIERGGHNPLEPAALGKPVLTGSHIFNFADVYRNMFESGAAIKIGEEDLARKLLELLQNDSMAKKIGRQGLKVVEVNRGALSKTMRIIEQFLK